MTTRHSVAVWIAQVHAFLETDDKARRAEARKSLKTMVHREIENTRAWLSLWEDAPCTFMAVSEGSESTFIYGPDFGQHLQRKIALMETYGTRKPKVDRAILWRVKAGQK